MLCHYCSYDHHLEVRRAIAADAWRRFEEVAGPGAFLVGLSSIPWREAWKYGERAWRYCQHDCGHAIGAASCAAACLGWRVRLIDPVPTATLRTLLGLEMPAGPEAEHADCLLLVEGCSPPATIGAVHAAIRELAEQLSATTALGTPNRLSYDHHEWEAIERAARAAEVPPDNEHFGGSHSEEGETPPASPVDSDESARAIIRRRRSAVDMDGETGMAADEFYGLMGRLMPDATGPLRGVLPWEPCVSLALFVHRVAGLEPGLYALVRNAGDLDSLRQGARQSFAWSRPAGRPAGLPFFLLQKGDCRAAARAISCGQDIASDGAFAVGMLARCEQPVRERGAWFYQRLFWETGLIGQALYLGAEAAGIAGTGIGCFFDDEMHRLLGLEGLGWQSLYHFTVGGRVNDPRLLTLAPYSHLTTGDC